MKKTDAAPGLVKGLRESAKDGYLGDSSLVESLVRDFASKVFAAQSIDDAYAAVNAIADIFAGVTEGFVLIEGWHDRGHLGMKACERLAINPDQSYQDILRAAFADYATQLVTIAKQSADKPESDWGWQIDAVIEHAVALMMGTIDLVFPLDEDA